MKTDRLQLESGLYSQNGGLEVENFLADFKPSAEEKERLRNVALKIRLLTRTYGVQNTRTAFLAAGSNGKPNYQNRYHHSFFISKRMKEEQAVAFFEIVISNYFILLGNI